ncbi:hypothetical protein SAMN05444515_10370 [Ectothiorhodospira marina]|uniref:N-acetyltransferase domain-containing protein n=1 Tax=Ectothiorhodospira marina TaxID=1396821 RepID=A0A1H7I8Z9_9GAMM|nr:hypothetical protein SAMN05444515_10370 [Ectothiorhodospira marina]
MQNTITQRLKAPLRHIRRRYNITTYRIYALSVEDIKVPRFLARSHVRQLHPTDPALSQIPRTQEEIAYRFQCKGTCIGEAPPSSTSLNGYLWLLEAPYTEPEHRCTLILPPNTAMDVDVYIARHARGSLTFARLWAEASVVLKQKGLRASICRIDTRNKTSIKAHERLGARSIGWQTFLCLGPLEVMCCRLPPYLSVTTRASPVPQIQIPTPPGKASSPFD